MQPYTPHGDSNLKVHTLVKKLSDATLFLLRFADFCGAPTGACKNRSAAPAVASLFRPLDALAAAAPHGDSNDRKRLYFAFFRMQPYTPHGDSNRENDSDELANLGRCNLIPLTGTVTSAAWRRRHTHWDATLYPSRGQ